MFEALAAQQRSENPSEDKISADEKMKVALELKGKFLLIVAKAGL